MSVAASDRPGNESGISSPLLQRLIHLSLSTVHMDKKTVWHREQYRECAAVCTEVGGLLQTLQCSNRTVSYSSDSLALLHTVQPYAAACTVSSLFAHVGTFKKAPIASAIYFN